MSAVLSSLLAKKNKAFSTNDPPGPKIELPIIGSLHLLGEKPHHSLAQLHKKFGGIYKLWMGDYYTVVVSDPHYIREIWLKNNDNFINRPHTPSYTIMSGNFTDLATADEKVWRHNRGLVAGAFTKSKLGGTQTIIARQCKRLIDMMNLCATQGQSFDPKINSKKYSMNIISSMVFSREIAYGNDNSEILYGKDFGQILKQMEEVFRVSGTGNPGDFISILEPFYYYQLKMIGQEVDKLLEFIKNIYDDHISTLDPENPKDLFDHIIIDGGDDVNGVLRIGGDLLLAGTDTSSNTIQWFVLMMANHPEIQEKVFAELKNRIIERGHIEETNENAGNRMVHSDRLETPYLNAVIKETMRIHPIGPLSIPRSAKNDIVIGDYFIPANTQMILNIYALHHDESYYDQPHLFNPDRFINENNTSHYLPFSIGARNCVGMAVAEMEIYLAVANIMANFKIKSVDGKQIDDTEVFGLAVFPNDFNILLEKRSIF
ncbi:cytochrome P450 family protein [Cavenderia fasciculata]|uniref:Cytochrome P450 family protein n=1 Tax=Cavenderia fasciculata TaxID=261658 RepID=F4Q2L0_CACFS|nr:cytochrome P450 family protein [Cavenderia fasciculata]EGG16689.1 cytochrome P450 family protein [Cavenderia fasciculata]|eukprot:XP_004355163.1 cytochrome P450 family protein [Cavenderia fasciculata]